MTAAAVAVLTGTSSTVGAAAAAAAGTAMRAGGGEATGISRGTRSCTAAAMGYQTSIYAHYDAIQ